MSITKSQALRNMSLGRPNVITKANTEVAVGYGAELVGSDVAKDIADLILADGTIVGQAESYEVGAGKDAIKVPVANDPLQYAQVGPAVGTRAYFLDQANAATASVPQIAGKALSLKTLITLIQASQELVLDVVNIDDKIDAFSTSAARKAIEWNMIFGSSPSPVQGVGYLGDSHEATLTTAFSAVPTESQLETAFNLLHPAAIDGAAWYVSQVVYTALSKSAYPSVDRTLGKLTAFGLPVVVNPFMAAAPRHILLGNFAAYGIAYKIAKADKSDEVNLAYLSNSEMFRLAMRVGGGAVATNTALDDGVLRAWFVSPTETAVDMITDIEAYEGNIYAYGTYLTATVYRNKKGAWVWDDSGTYYISMVLGDETNCYVGGSTLAGTYTGQGTCVGTLTIGAANQSSSSESSESSASSVSSVSSLSSQSNLSSQSSVSSVSSVSSASSQSQSSQSAVALTVGTGLTPTAAGTYDAAGTHDGQPMFRRGASNRWIWYSTSAGGYIISGTPGVTSGGYAFSGTVGTDPTGIYAGTNGWTGSAAVTA